MHQCYVGMPFIDQLTCISLFYNNNAIEEHTTFIKVVSCSRNDIVLCFIFHVLGRGDVVFVHIFPSPSTTLNMVEFVDNVENESPMLSFVLLVSISSNAMVFFPLMILLTLKSCHLQNQNWGVPLNSSLRNGRNVVMDLGGPMASVNVGALEKHNPLPNPSQSGVGLLGILECTIQRISHMGHSIGFLCAMCNRGVFFKGYVLRSKN